MSIIHEALKKVEAANNPQVKAKPAGKNRANLKIYLLYLIVAGLGFLSANLIFSFFAKPLHKAYPAAKQVIVNRANKPIELKPATQPPSPQPPSAAEEAARENEAPPPLTLTGVFFSGEQGYALINNVIVKKGDKIAGATVVGITSEGVELKTSDSGIKLSPGQN
jgi:hypothetical protein